MRKTRFILLLLLVLALGSNSCKKDETFILNIVGKITDPHQNLNVAGATVKLSAQEINGGTWSSTYREIASTTTSSAGDYSFDFERKNVVDYHIDIVQDGYYTKQISISPDDIKPDATYSANYTLAPQAWFTLHIRNSNPVDEDDNLTYYNNQNVDCPNCCSGVQKHFPGTAIDTAITCPLIGSENLPFSWLITKSGITVIKSNTVFCPPYDTTHFTINY